jgi:hypothetical protein
MALKSSLIDFVKNSFVEINAALGSVRDGLSLAYFFI